MEPGTPIGIISAQEVMQVATQSNLSSFHAIGLESNSETSGTSSKSFSGTKICMLHPGIKEIMDLPTTQKMSSMIISNVPDTVLPKDITEITFKSLLIGMSNSFLGINNKDSWYKIGVLLGLFLDVANFQGNNTKIRFYLDPQKLYAIGIRSLEIFCNTLFPDYDVTYSPMFLGIIDVYHGDKDGLIDCLQALDKKVFGISGIRKIGTNRKGEIITHGSNIKEVLRLRGIKLKDIYSNNIKDVERYLGVEAARKAIRKELLRMYNKDSLHPTLIADFMTWHGKVTPFTKNNLHLSNKGFLSSMAFEKAKKDLRLSTKHKLVDKGGLVYLSIIINNTIPLGTGNANFDIIEQKAEDNKMNK
ncbi:beta and beta-prime subunits of DNA dependent RNA-polymerase [Basidiobolus meristosporus CBS 931.73]|uniref:DNA-directed RNA polymerase n=1 Tax=Basidiobolus meristosporus CBS 931.73 TaxID=1314790 RepID=A0A1Y1XZS2_9FUNG|nr:beta and beta-prime subunits of DNA dependent RNA-polymerase [Basidiobolus meristosporus CBS 931.73]|eukprot:ORX91242.1 beta and beta-prime subunits of DNA dependent RNA-polymerase [Basidiobolus meristosporus CBS 931.73]